MFIPEPPYKSQTIPNESEKSVIKRMRQTLIGDIDRLVKNGRAEYISSWDPSVVYLPPKNIDEFIPFSYLELWMRPFSLETGEKPCRMGRLCQGNTLRRIMRDAPVDCGFTLPIFVTPSGKTHGQMCVLCLWLAMTRAYIQGKEPFFIWQSLPLEGTFPGPRFRVSRLHYKRGKIIYI